MQQIPEKEELQRALDELDVKCNMYLSCPPMYWFYFGYLLSGTIAGDGWPPQHEKMIKEFLDAIEGQIVEISPYAAKLMRRDESAE